MKANDPILYAFECVVCHMAFIEPVEAFLGFVQATALAMAAKENYQVLPACPECYQTTFAKYETKQKPMK